MNRGLGNDPEYVRPRPNAEDHDPIVSLAIQDAIQYVDEVLAPERVKATEYYHGLPFGDEMRGRSQAVLTEVRDNILGVIPSVLRVLHGPEHTVEYVPKRGDQVDAAQQATDYIRYVFEEDNKGFLITHSVLKDALLKKLGVVKWGIEEVADSQTTRYAGVTREELALLAADESADLRVVAEHPDGTFDVEHTVSAPTGRIWVMPIPTDDFFWNREARSLDEATLVGHRDRLTKGELLAMGISEEEIDAHGGADIEPTLEEQARRVATTSGMMQDAEMGEENRRYVYCEAYVMLTMDAKRGRELRKVCTLGPAYAVIKNVPAASRPFAMFSPDPEPHAMLGGSWYDLLKDAQRINSHLMRGMLDSLSVSLFPRPIYVDGQANQADILNTAIGAPIRERLPNMVRWDAAPFTGEKVLPIMDFMRGVIENRTGQKDGAGSLDMDALQSTGKEAVNAAILAAQSQAELLTRLYAEQLLKPMFKGLLTLAADPRSRERIVRLNGNYVPVNPSAWDPTMDVSINVALGSMDTAKKVMTLEKVVADQSAILEQYGPDNPVVSLAMLRNAKAKALRLSGIKDVENYYKPVDPNWQPPPPPPPEPSEDELWRQAEAKMAFEKNMKDLAIKQDELALATRKQEADEAFRARELAIQEADSIRDAETGPHNAEIERYKADQDHLAKMEQIASQERMERERLLVQLEIAKLNAGVKLDVADTQAAAKAQVSRETSGGE